MYKPKNILKFHFNTKKPAFENTNTGSIITIENKLRLKLKIRKE